MAKQADTVRQGSIHLKEARGQVLDFGSKAKGQYFIGTLNISLKVRWDQNKADQNLADDISDRKLEESQIAVIGKGWDPDEGESAWSR